MVDANSRGNSRLAAEAVVAMVAMFLVVWAGYRFSFEPINIHIRETVMPLEVSRRLTSIPVPAPEVLRGLEYLLIWHAQEGHPGYLLGETGMRGWWYFFPVALFFKTPLSVLVLAGIGPIAGIMARSGDRFREVIYPTLAFLAILAAVLPSTITIGLRHVLPLYALMSIGGGIGVTYMVTRVKSRWLGHLIAGILMGSLAISSVFSHPQYIPYFNIFEKLIDDPILVDSDRDWGQAVGLLKDFVEENKIESIHVASLSFHERDIENYNLTNFKYLQPYQQPSGWIAASYWRVYADKKYSWLLNYEPVTILGDAMLVYKLP